MASITSVISLFVLLLATYCCSLPIDQPSGKPTPGHGMNIGQSQIDHENKVNMHLVADGESHNVPNTHKELTSGERDSGEDKSPMPPTSGSTSTDKNQGIKRDFLVEQPDPYEIKYVHEPSIAYILASKRGINGEGQMNESSINQSSSDKTSEKRDYIIDFDRTVSLTHHVPLTYYNPSVSYILTSKRELKDGIPMPESSKEESSLNKTDVKRDYFVELDRTYTVAHYPVTTLIDSPSYMFYKRELKDDASKPESSNEESSLNKTDIKRDYIVELDRTYTVAHYPVTTLLDTPSYMLYTRELKDGVPMPESSKEELKNDTSVKRDILYTLNTFNRAYTLVDTPLTTLVHNPVYVYGKRELKDGVPMPESSNEESKK